MTKNLVMEIFCRYLCPNGNKKICIWHNLDYIMHSALSPTRYMLLIKP